MMGSVCAALYARERTGLGQKIETTLLGQALNLMGARFLHVERLDRETREKALREIKEKQEAGAPFEDIVAASPGSRRREHHGNIYYRVYMTSDGPIGIGCLSGPLRVRLLDTLALTDDALEPGWDPNKPESQAYSRELERTAEALFLAKTSGEWLKILEEQGIPAGPVRFIEELFDDPQVAANGLVTEFEHSQEGKVRMVGPVAKFSATPLPDPGPSPALGEHAEATLEWLGYTPAEIHRLRQENIVG